MDDQQGQNPQWLRYRSGNTPSQKPPYEHLQWEQQSPQQHTQHPQYVTPPVPNYVSPQQPQWPPQQYPHQLQHDDHPQLSQYPPQYASQWQQPPSQPLSPQLMQPIPPQIRNKKHSKKKIGFIIGSAIILTITFVLGIALGMNLKNSSNPGLSSSTSVPSNSASSLNSLTPTQVATSLPTPIPTPIQASPAKVGDTITMNNVACTLVSVKFIPDDGISVPKTGDIFVVIHLKLINNSTNDFDYLPTDFKGKSGSGNVTAPLPIAPNTYTANNYIGIGTLSPGGTLEGDIVIEVPITTVPVRVKMW